MIDSFIILFVYFFSFFTVMNDKTEKKQNIAKYMNK